MSYIHLRNRLLVSILTIISLYCLCLFSDSEISYAAPDIPAADFVVPEKLELTDTGNGKLECDTYTIISGKKQIQVESIKFVGKNGWEIVNKSTDFSKLSVNDKKISLVADGHDMIAEYSGFEAFTYPQTLDISFEGQIGASRQITNEEVGNIVTTISIVGGIPDGATYTTADGTELNEFPETPTAGDSYIEGDYKYVYNGYYDYFGRFNTYDDITGWYCVGVIDNSKTEYADIRTEICNEKITVLYNTFENCDKMINAPNMPDSVKVMYRTFQGCDSFNGIDKLPDNLERLDETFNGCVSLKEPPVIPDEVTNMQATFYGCTSLEKAPVIPNGVTNMQATFYRCTALKTAPDIPESVEIMNSTFYCCTSLSGRINIYSENVNTANQNYYNECFYGTVNQLILYGTNNNLVVRAMLMATANNGNVILSEQL